MIGEMIYVFCMHINLVANKVGALVTALSDVLTSPQYSSSSDAALVTLFHRQPISVTSLAQILGLTQSATTRLVQRLKSEKLIQQQDMSGRERLLSLSKEGEQIAAALGKFRLDRIAEILSPLSDDDRQALDRIVSSLLINLVEDETHARHMCRHCDHGICRGEACPVGSEIRRKEKMEKSHDSEA